MAIDATHPQHDANLGKWSLIGSILDEVKLTEHLLTLNEKDKSDDNIIRNKLYKKRAVFYALAGQTASGMLGTVYAKPPTVELPELLEYMNSNIDGRGNSISQQSKRTMAEVISKSRNGLFTSFPESDGPISRADVLSGKSVAAINTIKAPRIINWGESSSGAKIFLSLVVFHDTKTVIEDYVHTPKEFIRELFIDSSDGNYKERHWVKVDEKWVVEGEIRIPTDHSGNPLKEIPFTFVGSENNDPDVDRPIMYSMCSLNVSHYRNSADFEDNVWWHGQSQAWMSNVDQDHIDLMNENDMYLGSRNLIAVPEGGAYGIEAAPPNVLVRQAMLDKVDMMIGIGARMIAPGGVAKTAEQSSNEREMQHSMLSLATENVNDAYMRSLTWAALYMGADLGEDDKFELNGDFVKPNVTHAELKEVIAGWLTGAIPSIEYIDYMKKYGIFDEEKPSSDYSEQLPVPSSIGDVTGPE